MRQVSLLFLVVGTKNKLHFSDEIFWITVWHGNSIEPSEFTYELHKRVRCNKIFSL